MSTLNTITANLSIQNQDSSTNQAILWSRTFPSMVFNAQSETVYSGYVTLPPQSGLPFTIFSGLNVPVALVRNVGSSGFVNVQWKSAVQGSFGEMVLSPGGVWMFYNQAGVNGDANVGLTILQVVNDTSNGITFESMFSY